MNCLSINYKLAPVSHRKAFAFPEGKRTRLLESFRPLGGCVLVSTCNRTELYFLCSRRQAEEKLALAAGLPVEGFAFFTRQDAVEHLFRLAAGLESMLIGEDEILGQLKHSYEQARQLGLTQGLDTLFQAAIACGKRVRSETKISSLACSVATLAANQVFHFGKPEKTVLLIGASGQIGTAVYKNLQCRKELTLLITSRSHGREEQRTLPYENRYQCLDGADVILCCTASPHTILTVQGVKEHLRTQKERLFLDLSVPPDIDSEVDSLPGCRRVGIDDLRWAAEENNRQKQHEIEQAEKLTRLCLLEYQADQAARQYAAEMDGLEPSLRQSFYALRKEDPAAFLQAVKERFQKEEL